MNRDSLIVGDLVLEIGAASVNKQTEGICGASLATKNSRFWFFPTAWEAA